MKSAPTIVLIILDGFGVNPEKKWNAVLSAQTPTLNTLFEKYPHSTLNASEERVGLPTGYFGNSEVGHLNIGAGRVVYQDLSLISKAIEDGSFYKNNELKKMMNAVKEKFGSLHLMGLMSDGGVHSHIEHCFAALQLAKNCGIQNVWIHAFTDGRDTSPTSGALFLKNLERRCQEVGNARVATVAGRFFAMDRDKRWERTEQSFNAIVYGKGTQIDSVSNYVASFYSNTGANTGTNTGDEFIPPGVRAGYTGFKAGDGVFFLNFRADRARQLSRAITQNFSEFKIGSRPELAGFVCMTPYDVSLNLKHAFEKPKVPSSLGEIVSRKGWKQLRIAETEKYAHVTYFFNGGDETEFDGEKRILVPSPRDVKTYDLKPEMAAREVTAKLIKELDEDYQLIVVNYANTDMVGHTGDMAAAIKAVEVVDECVGKIVSWIESHGAIGILTSDHGNCEKMRDEKGEPLTSHTLSRVPFVLIDPLRTATKVRDGNLCDIAPTILSLWGIEKPKEMTGISLLL